MKRTQPDTELASIPEASAVFANAADSKLGPTAAQLRDGPHFASPSAAGELGRLGKYRIQKELGRGGMGAVYLALDERLQRRVALKVMLPAAATDTLAKERFLREARAAAQISNDHVVSIYEAEEINGTPYISLQFLQGYPLDEYVKKYGNPSIPQIIRIGQETAMGLDAAHRLGLIHRDIKPANLWLEAPNGRVKILDFGLARQREESVVLTQEGRVIGTPAYMSPEQGRGLPLDLRSDLFSLGSVLYQLCTGRLPFQGDTLLALLTALAVDDPTPVRALNPQVPEALANLIHRLLSKQSAHRPPTGQSVADELNEMFKLAQSPVVVNGQLPVVYVPMAITSHEPNPFEDITQQIGTESGALAEEAAPEPSSEPFPVVRVAAIGFAFLAVVAVVVAAYLSINPPKRDNPEVATITPDVSPPVKVNPPVTTNPPLVTEGDQSAAAYVLSVGGVVRVNDEERDVKNAANLPKTPFKLTSVDLAGNVQVTDEGLAKFKGCTALAHLNLNGTKTSNAGLVHFKDCKNLKSLSLGQTPIGDAGLANFKGCKQLTQLDLNRSQITDLALFNFADCTELQEVYVQYTTVGNEVANTLKRSTHLKLFQLEHTNLDDGVVKALLDKTELLTLNIQSTKVTAAGLETLQAALPRCRIIHSGGVIEPKK